VFGSMSLCLKKSKSGIAYGSMGGSMGGSMENSLKLEWAIRNAPMTQDTVRRTLNKKGHLACPPPLPPPTHLHYVFRLHIDRHGPNLPLREPILGAVRVNKNFKRSGVLLVGVNLKDFPRRFIREILPSHLKRKWFSNMN
jgi:hypothetical protein